MLKKTRENIYNLYKILFSQEFKGKLNSYCTDFTILKRDLFSNLSEFIYIYDSCDYVIGNPPYISLYGRRDKKKNESQRQFYLDNYQQFPTHVKNGKINYIMLFIEQGINFLKQNGVLSFIVDIAFFETAYQYCRQYLVQNYTIEKLVYNLKVFDNVTSGQILIEIKKNKPLLNHQVNLIDYDTNNINLISQSHWDNPQDEFRFRLPNSSDLTPIINKIFDKQDKTLKDIRKTTTN
ncbi:MAG: SAM-dependent DNA methyltransferase [Geminocystis sp. GBBB08]|nr:N-6 DNA methylase [Geminocystis sp. GBBB08]MBL1209013.1 SAM-dependent DNA methyltransferase [Geminocystis sp. GBBB08]